jgi:hypothetical protein
MAIIDCNKIFAEKFMPRVLSTMLDEEELYKRCGDEKYAKVLYSL